MQTSAGAGAQASPKPPTTWAIVHTVRAGRRTARILRQVIHSVPRRVGRRELRELLERHGFNATYSTAGIPWAGFVLLERAAWPETWDAGELCAPDISWADLNGKEAGVRRVTIELDAPSFALVKLVAAAEGLSTQRWAAGALVYVARLQHDQRASQAPETSELEEPR